MVLDLGADRRQSSSSSSSARRPRSRIGDCRSRRAGSASCRPSTSSSPRPSVAARGEIGRARRWPGPSPPPRRARSGSSGVIGPALVRIVNSSASVQPRRRRYIDRLPRAVPRELCLRAVGVEDPQLGDIGRVLVRESSRIPSEPTPNVPVADPLDSLLVQLPRAAPPPRRSGSRCRAPSTSRTSSQHLDRPRPPPVREIWILEKRPRSKGSFAVPAHDEFPLRAVHDLVGDLRVRAAAAIDQGDALHPPHPGELAAGVGAVGRLDRLDRLRRGRASMSRSSCSKPSAARAVREAPASAAPLASSAAPAAIIASTRASIRSASSSRSTVRPDEQRRLAQLRRPQALARPVRPRSRRA